MTIAFLTPDAEGEVYLSRRLRFRSELARFVTGMLEGLTNPGAWEEEGDLTVSDMVNMATESLNYYLDSRGSMIGTLVDYITSTPPDGVLPCDGSTYDGDDYPELFAVLQISLKNLDGSFTLPDLRGRVTLGAGQGAGLTNRVFGSTVGEEDHQLGENELPPHDHTYDQPDTTTIAGYLGDTPAQVPWHQSGVTGQAGNGDSFSLMQPGYVVYKGVWYK